MTNSPQPKSWRDVLPIHPAAELFPRMFADADEGAEGDDADDDAFFGAVKTRSGT